MTEVICAPGKWARNGKTVLFLAGSIDMGSATDWQANVIDSLQELPLLILNPRRDDWDSSWKQGLYAEPFRAQVLWELEGLERSDLILMYFAEGSKSPITLLELGLCAAQWPDKLIVCSSPGFWRKGNIDIVTQRYGVTVYDSLEAAIIKIKSLVTLATPSLGQ